MLILTYLGYGDRLDIALKETEGSLMALVQIRELGAPVVLVQPI